jgi:hypothetical protein
MTCGPKGEELREGCRGITIMCAVPKILRNHTQNEMGGTCITHWDLKNDYTILVGLSTGKKQTINLSERNFI